MSEGLSTIIWVVKWWGGGGLWDSLDHHGDGDVVVVGEILSLISILLQDGVEGVIPNNLSERLKSNRFDVIKAIGWRNLKSNSFNFIDWNINQLGELIEGVTIGSLGLDEGVSLWSSMSWGGLGSFGGVVVSASLDEGDTFVLLSTMLFVVVLVLK